MRALSDHEIKFLADLRYNPVFISIIENHVKPAIPELPAYTVDEQGDNRAEWMAASLERDGFIRCLSLLGVAND